MKRLPLILIFVLLLSISFTLIVGAESGDISFDFNIILVAVIAMLITILIFVIAVVVSYKKKLRGTIYPFDKFTTLDLTDYSDVYTHSHTTRYKYRDSSSNRK